MNPQDNYDGCIFNKINDVVEENTENGSFAGSNQDLITGIKNTIFTRNFSNNNVILYYKWQRVNLFQIKKNHF